MKTFFALLSLFSLELNARIGDKMLAEQELEVAYSNASRKIDKILEEFYSDARRAIAIAYGSKDVQLQRGGEERFQLRRNDSFNAHEKRTFHSDDSLTRIVHQVISTRPKKQYEESLESSFHDAIRFIDTSSINSFMANFLATDSEEKKHSLKIFTGILS